MVKKDIKDSQHYFCHGLTMQSSFNFRPFLYSGKKWKRPSSFRTYALRRWFNFGCQLQCTYNRRSDSLMLLYEDDLVSVFKRAETHQG